MAAILLIAFGIIVGLVVALYRSIDKRYNLQTVCYEQNLRIAQQELTISRQQAQILQLVGEPVPGGVSEIETGKISESESKPETELSKYLCAPVDTPQRIADLYYKCHPELRFHEFWLEHTKTNRLDKELYDYNPDDHTLTKIDHRTPAEKAAGNMCVG